MEPVSDRQKRQQDKEKFWSPMLGKSFAEVVKQNRSIGERKRGRSEKLRDPNVKAVGFEGNLGLAKLEDGKALLEFELKIEAEKALKDGVISVNGFDIQLEKWSQRTGCLMEEEKEREAWVRILGLPISLWDRDILRKIGEGCGGFLDIDAKTERMEELQPTLRMLSADEKGKTLAAAGEVEGEVQSRKGKRVMEAEGGSRLEDQTQLRMGRGG
ncbi:hypothetical protein CK203_033504 [Vitis vinifera]|uniref:Uncharacterized protein n=1 Tax=Vitis vinifera TaxID=29760 RepID=A0A438FL88_VITVI|nr:hypothetical protein CK203_033504 [Vitis vinifera]